MACCFPKVKPFPDVTVMALDDFKAFGEIPTFSVSKSKLKNMNSIDVKDSLVVFISHAWLQESLPDNNKNEKHQLIVEGISKLKSDMAPSLTNCYIWIDYSCFKGSEKNKIDFQTMFHDIVMHCDCMFTPLVDQLSDHWKLEYTTAGYFQDYKASSWNGGMDRSDKKCYLNRAWCRTESFYCANVPLYGLDEPSSISKISKYSGCLKRLADLGQRPHFIYGHREHALQQAPLNLAHLQNTYFEDYHPMKGELTVEGDRVIIQTLVQELEQRYAQQFIMGYLGDYDEKGYQNGAGRYYSAKYDVFEGFFKNNKRHQHGIYYAPNGDFYDGNWNENRKSGDGEMYFINGDIYSGKWDADMFEGQGKMIYAHGPYAYYEGSWSAGKRHGQGKCVYRQGERFIEVNGSWSKNQTKGKCHIKYADGSIYDGDTKDTAMHGKGQLTSSAGKYKGDFKNDEFCGRGHMEYTNGDVYNGEWHGGVMEGRGSLVRDGEEYDGNFKGGLKCGQGKMVYKDKTVYVGEWKDDLTHGCGKLISADEKVVQIIT